jgi:hypothetical protein
VTTDAETQPIPAEVEALAQEHESFARSIREAARMGVPDADQIRWPRRVTIALAFSVDLDRVRGFGHEPDDWCKWVRSQLERQNCHYRPRVDFISVQVRSKRECADAGSVPAR